MSIIETNYKDLPWNDEFPNLNMILLYESGGDFLTYSKLIGYTDFSKFEKDCFAFNIKFYNSFKVKPEIHIAWFDLETTGTNPAVDQICELSVIKTTLSGSLVAQKTVLIKPSVSIPEGATNIHGISDESVKDKPSFKQYSKGIYDFIKGCILGGYNIKRFDIPLLVEEFLRCGIDLDVDFVIDCYEIVTQREKRDLTWALKYYAGEVMQDAHKAENDVNATIKIFDGQKFMYSDLDQGLGEGISTFETLDFAGKIDKDGKYTFGKHKGLKVTHDYDTVSFANWMLNPKQEFTLNTKNVIKKILKEFTETQNKVK